LATFAYSKFNTKLILVTVICGMAVSLIMFTQTADFNFLMFCRFLTGFFQVFISIYYPVWSDTFGSNDKIKTMWLTLLLLCGPIGTLIGYMIGGSIVGRGLDWRYAFYI
jgi:predicted MFS family arabinose efflux permease